MHTNAEVAPEARLGPRAPWSVSADTRLDRRFQKLAGRRRVPLIAAGYDAARPVRTLIRAGALDVCRCR